MHFCQLTLKVPNYLRKTAIFLGVPLTIMKNIHLYYVTRAISPKLKRLEADRVAWLSAHENTFKRFDESTHNF